MEIKDTYKTILKPSQQVLFKDKNSKFYGYAFPVTNLSDIKICIEQLKKDHHNARHWCYAYQLGEDYSQYRANDDGEPKNSAGQPIYGQIQSFNLTNTLIVVVRYFGGVKLGVSGLINAYKTCAQLALSASTLIEKTINLHLSICFEYKDMSKVMRIIKEKQLIIENQKLETSCLLKILVRKKNYDTIYKIFDELYGVVIKKNND